jgi:hypothetical protein
MQTVLVLAVCLSSTVVDVPPIERMVERADVVAHGVVKSATVVKEGKKIFTYTTVEILDPIKGAKKGSEIVISQVGGLYEGKNIWVSGAHHFQIGEEMVFFAARWRDEIVVPFGVGFGVFDIVDDGSGRRVIKEAVGDVVSIKTGKHPETRTFESVDDFKSSLREMAARPPSDATTTKQPRRIEQNLPKVRR